MDYPIPPPKFGGRASIIVSEPSEQILGLAADCPTFLKYWSSQQFRKFFRRMLPFWATISYGPPMVLLHYPAMCIAQIVSYSRTPANRERLFRKPPRRFSFPPETTCNRDRERYYCGSDERLLLLRYWEEWLRSKPSISLPAFLRHNPSSLMCLPSYCPSQSPPACIPIPGRYPACSLSQSIASRFFSRRKAYRSETRRHRK